MKFALWIIGCLGGFGVAWKMLIGQEAWAIHWLMGWLMGHPAFKAFVVAHGPEIKQVIDIAAKEIDADIGLPQS